MLVLLKRRKVEKKVNPCPREDLEDSKRISSEILDKTLHSIYKIIFLIHTYAHCKPPKVKVRG